MPRTVEHIVQTHQLAAGLRAAGKPVWRYHLELSAKFHDETCSYEERRDAVVADLMASKWYRRQEEGEESELWQLVDELKDAEDTRHFDAVWDAVYDLADNERCWIDAFKNMP